MMRERSGPEQRIGSENKKQHVISLPPSALAEKVDLE